jgi:hypothetical protein
VIKERIYLTACIIIRVQFFRSRSGDANFSDIYAASIVVEVSRFMTCCAFTAFCSEKKRRDSCADRSGHAVYGVCGTNCLRQLEHWDRGLNPTRGMDVCVRLFCVVVGRGLATS